MNLKYLILFFVLLNVTYTQAQTKPKISTQPAKPTKAFTIKYLNEKLSQNCSGPSQKKDEYLFGYNDGSGSASPEIMYRTSYNNQDYLITERDGIGYLSCKKIVSDKKVNFKNHSEDYDRTSNLLVEIPINKIIDIKFWDVPAKTEGKGDVITTYKERVMGIFTKDNDVLMKDLEKGNQQNTSVMVFPSFNMEDEGKMKRAFFNLKSYYKEEADPFADEKSNETSIEKNQDNNTVKSLDIESTVNLISMKLQSSQFPDEVAGCDVKYKNDLGALGIIRVQNSSNWKVRLVGKKLYLLSDKYFDLEHSTPCYSCTGSTETNYLLVFEAHNDGTTFKLLLKIKFPDQQTGNDFCDAIGDLVQHFKNQ